MAASSSRPDPSSPASVASAAFTTSRKGFDQDEVRSFLQQVSRELSAALDAKADLERRAAASPDRPALDEATVASLLGEEMGRVLSTAHAAATQVRAKAEEGAARLLRDAQDESTHQREEADLYAERVRRDADEDVAAQRQTATDEAARMRQEAIDAARAEREAAERDADALRGGARTEHDELLAAARAEAERLRAEAMEQADQSRTTAADEAAAVLEAAKAEGRHMVAEARAVRERMLTDLARRRDAARQQLEWLLAGRDRVLQAFLNAHDVTGDAIAELQRLEDAELPEHASVPVAGAEELDAMLAASPDEPATSDEVIDAALADTPDPSAGPRTDDEEQGKLADVHHLFERIRAARTDEVAARVAEHPAVVAEAGPAPPEATPEQEAVTPEAAALAARNDTLDPIQASLAKALKRALANEQNRVLDRLRRQPKAADLVALVGEPDEQAATYRDAARADLGAAGAAGARSLGGAQPTDDVLTAGLSAVVTDLVQPLRDRLQRGLAQAGGDAVEAGSTLRATYREWRTQKLDVLAADLARGAYGRGAFAALAAGEGVCWVVDNGGTPCPDADDNALAGRVGAGDPFPTGHLHPPAHAGCRCVLLRVGPA